MLPRALSSRLWIVLAVACLAGCQPAIRPERQSDDAALFGPAEIRVHPFTAVKDWTSDQRPDGIEALIELLDRMRDPTKATGTVVFELYVYRRNYPDPRGERLAAWRGSLLSMEDQRLHYNRISRTYSFQLAYPEIRADKPYVLQVWFEHAGKRLTTQVVLEAQETKSAPPIPVATAPATRPGETRPATRPGDTRPAGPGAP